VHFVSILDTLIKWDKHLFLLLNSLNNTLLDPLMYAASGTTIWIPLFLFWLYRIKRLLGISIGSSKQAHSIPSNFSQKDKKRFNLQSRFSNSAPLLFWLCLLIVLAIGITISDQTASGLMKPYFKRLRPCNDPTISLWVHIVNGYCSKSYSFCSSHASNSTFIATFFTLGIWKADRWLWGTAWVWALLHSYSRIYLGVHFPLDLIAGAAIGITTAWVLHLIIVRKFFRSLGSY
jgi:undecaprenyl-diphosphatase